MLPPRCERRALQHRSQVHYSSRIRLFGVSLEVNYRYMRALLLPHRSGGKTRLADAGLPTPLADIWRISQGLQLH